MYIVEVCQFDPGVITLQSAHAFFNGHKKSDSGRNFKRYFVWKRKTGDLFVSGGTAKECAAAMGISLDYFYSILYFQSLGRSKKWDIESYFEDTPVDEADDNLI